MKKIIGSLTAVFFAVSAFALTAAAQTVVQPNFPMHENQCGTVVVKADIDRDVFVTIVKNSPDGKYAYYDHVISADISDRECKFALEGSEDVDYTVTIGVPKFKGSADNQVFSENIVVFDTEEITDQIVSEYKFTYLIGKNDVEEITVSKTKENVKNSDNVIESNTEILFSSPDFQRGDANNDGKISIKDAAFIAKMIAQRKKDKLLIEYCDYNNDGSVNIRDAMEIAKFLAKRIKKT